MAKRAKKALKKAVEVVVEVIDKAEPVLEVAASVDPRAKQVKRALALMRRVRANGRGRRK